MEIKGEEFIKKVQIKQEKNELEEKLHKLEEVENHINTTKEYNNSKSKTKDTEQKLNDLLLDQSATKSDKKKYLFLGLVLIILFLLTIISIRLLTNNDKNEDSFISQKEKKIEQKIINNENIEDQYQKIMEQTIKNIEKKKEVKDKTTLQDMEEKLEKLKHLKINKAKEIISKQKNKVVKEIKQVQKKKQIIVKKAKKQIKKQIKKVIRKSTNAKKTFNKNIWPKKKVVRSEPKVVNSNQKQSKLQKNTFVQIGAFSKIPNKKYLNNITNLGYKYKIHKIYIKNKTFYKLLIGPYMSRNKASSESSKIKKKLNVTSTFILKL